MFFKKICDFGFINYIIKKKTLASNEIYIYDYTNIRKKTLFQKKNKNIQFNS